METGAPRNEILVGHSITMLREMRDACVQLVVTSPPYYSLREYSTERQVWGGDDPDCEHEWSDEVTVHNEREARISGKTRTTERYYGDGSRRYDGNHQKHMAGSVCVRCGAWRGELGQEMMHDCSLAASEMACGVCYVCHLVAVFREVRRVLRADGVVFLNLGDTYVNDAKWGGTTGGKHAHGLHGKSAIGRGKRKTGVPPKSLLLMPHRVALALQSDGWIVRNDHPWEKGNAMPESVADRCTRNHEYVFMLAKSPRYFFDIEAIAEPVAEASVKRISQSTFAQQTGGAKDYRNGTNTNRSARNAQERFAQSASEEGVTRHPRSVLHFNPAPFPAAHFATFPESLPEWAIKCGTSPRACEHCGAPWKRREKDPTVGKNAMRGSGHFRASPGGPANREGREWLRVAAVTTLGWEPTCRCADNTGAGRCIVLDPFGGAGTTALAAQRLDRDWLLCELNPSYASLSRRRILTAGCAHVALAAPEGAPELVPLFA